MRRLWNVVAYVGIVLVGFFTWQINEVRIDDADKDRRAIIQTQKVAHRKVCESLVEVRHESRLLNYEELQRNLAIHIPTPAELGLENQPTPGATEYVLALGRGLIEGQIERYTELLERFPELECVTDPHTGTKRAVPVEGPSDAPQGP